VFDSTQFVSQEDIVDNSRSGPVPAAPPASPDSRGADFSDQVVVITGGSRGLGLAMARAFAAAGAHLVIASRKLEVCREVARELSDVTGREAIGVDYHAASWDGADRLADAVYQQFGRCDVLVNNAGASPLYPSLVDVSEELFDKVVGINFKGPFRLGSLLGQAMADGDGGSIINISSAASVKPEPTDLIYAASKAAVNTLTTGLARAYAPKVRCNAILPGYFMTDISAAWDPAEFEKIAKTQIPLGRGGEPEEIVGAALYLASRHSSYTTGSTIRIDGGATHHAS
jgi:NAD(P)-dependent dehydrogenase (short-subunit alcohol dehydrogenase family)